MINRYTKITELAMIYLVILACFSIALPTAFMSIFISLFVIIWAISGKYAEKIQRIRNNPAALISIALFCFYGLGMLYSSAPWEMRFSWWMHYLKLLYIPLIISVLTDEKYRKMAFNAFLAGMLFMLLISYLKWGGIVPLSSDKHELLQGYYAFKGRIAHNIFLAFLIYLMLNFAVKSASKIKASIWIGLSILAVLNAFFLVNGRTGQVLIFALLLWFCWETWGGKSIKWLAAALFSIVLISPFLPTTSTHFRLAEIKQEIENHDPSGTITSSGTRLEYYKNALTLIQQHPVLGAGTGSFEHEYKKIAEKQNTINIYVPNPHNEFLLTWQELGIFGLLLLLGFFFTHWKTSYQIETSSASNSYYGYALRGLIMTIFIGSLFNSLLLDSGEGKFYCVMAGVLLSAYQTRKKPI